MSWHAHAPSTNTKGTDGAGEQGKRRARIVFFGGSGKVQGRSWAFSVALNGGRMFRRKWMAPIVSNDV